MNSWTDVAGWTLVHFVWQGAIIGLASAALLRIMRRTSPQIRYVAACAALGAMLTAPLVTAWALSNPVVVSSGVSASGPAPSSAHHEPAAHAPRTPADDVRSSAPSLAATDPAVDAWQPFVVACWLAGVAIFLARLLSGWWRVRRLHRAALTAGPSRWTEAASRIAAALDLHRIVRVADWPSIDTPTVIGWVRPVVVLPVAALSNLSPSQVDAILAHELAHVRRHDFVVNLLQTLVETLLFYHPAVWWLSGRVRAEREHCCDLIAVEVCGDPLSYAEALAELETWRTADASLGVAATGGSLVDRVRRLLGAPSEDGSWSPGTTSLVVAAVLLLLIAGASSALRATQSAGQSPSPDRPLLDDARDGEAWSVVFNHSTSQMRFIGFTGRDLIRFAYQFPGERVLGGPPWIDDETFRLVVDLDGPPAADETPGIVRRLLEERFKLQAHVDTRDVPVYALVMSRADGTPGPNLRTSSRDCFDMQSWIDAGQPPREVRFGAERQPVCGEEAWDSTISRKSYVAISMPQFAERLGGYSELATVQGRPWPRTRDVVDRTGLSGRYDVDIHAFRPAAALMGRYPLLEALFEPLGFPSMGTALEQQLGLMLEDATAPYDVIVIDYAERPSG